MEIGTVFPLVGWALIILGVIVLGQRVMLILGSKVISGTVVDIQEKYSRGSILYYPVIEYYNEETQTMETFTDIIGTFPSRHKTGDSVEIRYYNNGDKKELLTNGWFGLWGASIVVILMGVIFIIIGL